LSLPFKWKVTFNLLNTEPKQSLLIDGFEFDRHPESSKDLLKTSVTYRFTTGSAYSANIQDQTKDMIDGFLAVGNVNLALTGWDVREPVEDFELQIENRRELQKAGLNPPAKGEFQMRNTSTLTQEFVTSNWSTFSKLSAHKDSEVIFRTLRLLRHSMVEDDEYDRFSKVWRSFNALYNHLAGTRSTPEADRIGNFVSSLCSVGMRPKGWLESVVVECWTPLPKSTPLKHFLTLTLGLNNWSSVMDCLIKQTFHDNHGNNLSQSLAAAVAAKDVAKALESSLLCLYVERCKVEHGEIISEGERNLLYVCASYLQRIVAIALNEFYFIPLMNP
jgi:hypothetical protein